MAVQHFVYLYRGKDGAPMYVGYGRTAQRALSHRGESHNQKLRDWLQRSDFNLEIAGPYVSVGEAKAVEAALISSLRPKFNLSPGEGPKFVPVGVPPELSERPVMPALTLSELGRLGKGAILVYLSPGDYLWDGRRKFDPAIPSDETAVKNIEKYWDLTRLVETWRSKPDLMPTTILGIHGKVGYRFIVGSLEIDRERLCSPRNRRTGDRWPRPRWQVPLVDRSELDHLNLRGRRVDQVTFGQFSHQLHIWVDRSGRRRH